ncbi:hypothetical protein UNDKW_0063 [Undibacterium sp. KW1]|jgi:hypothetical protein|uniref:hypothetical protein n=1 Tax=Undibacterium sp. KW1 TaxID=2058624 RepID=UPI001331E63E|nr:hypothetical protein [Undibacterium sp. KW1]BBB58336.1 hypothetical protein UNDKW_0063 [Undibacterium sp. KW1]
MANTNDTIPFSNIRDALTSIESFRSVYASSIPSVEHAKTVVDRLRALATSVSQTNPHAAALYDSTATGIELYIGLKPLPE